MNVPNAFGISKLFVKFEQWPEIIFSVGLARAIRFVSVRRLYRSSISVRAALTPLAPSRERWQTILQSKPFKNPLCHIETRKIYEFVSFSRHACLHKLDSQIIIQSFLKPHVCHLWTGISQNSVTTTNKVVYHTRNMQNSSEVLLRCKERALRDHLMINSLLTFTPNLIRTFYYLRRIIDIV